MSEYEEIINLPHFEPKRHPRMSRYMRAAQFSSFAALTGFGDDIIEKGRLTENGIELEEYELSLLNEKMNWVIENQKDRPKITVTYFQKDEKKSGGKFITEKITVRLVDTLNRFIETDKREKISADNIISIKTEDEK